MTETQLLAFVIAEHAKHHKEISQRQFEGIRECVISIVSILNTASDSLVPPWGTPFPSGESFGHVQKLSPDETQIDGPGFSFIGMFRKGKAPITRPAQAE